MATGKLVSAYAELAMPKAVLAFDE